MTVPTNADLAIIVAFISTFLFGVFIAVAFRCFQFLYDRHKLKAKRMYLYRDLMITQSVLFVVILLRCIFVLYRAASSIIKRTSDGNVDLGDLDSPISSLVNIPWLLCVVVPDMFIAYHAFTMTWKRPVVLIAVPPAFAFAATCTGMWLIYLVTGTMFISPFAAAAKIFCFLTAITNIWCSGLILRHITVQRLEMMASEDRMLRGFTLIFVAIWTATVSLVIVVTTFVPVGNYLNFILKDMCPPYIGIIFSIIIIDAPGGQSYGGATCRKAWPGQVRGARPTPP